MKIIGNKILVKKEDTGEARSASGLILSAGAKGAYDLLRGKVTFASAGYVNTLGVFIELTVKTGDTVLFFRQGAVEFEHNLEKFYLISENEVVAVEESENAG